MSATFAGWLEFIMFFGAVLLLTALLCRLAREESE